MKFENFVSYAMRLSHELHFNIINCTQNTEYCHFTIFAITLPMNTDYEYRLCIPIDNQIDINEILSENVSYYMTQ